MSRSKSYSENDKLDVNAFFSKLLKHWYYFAISVPLFLGLGFLHIYLTTPVYEVRASMLIDFGQEEQKLGTGSTFMSSGGLFSNQENLKNEIAILKSFKMVQKPLKYLGFNVGYFKKDGFISKEIYKKSPFAIVPTEEKKQMINVPIFFKFISDETYQIEIDAEDFRVYLPDEKRLRVQKGKKFVHKQECTFGEPCANEYFDFVVFKQDWVKKIGKYKNEEFYFKLYDFDKMTHRYIKTLQIAQTDLDASVIELISEGEVIEKEVDFLNQLAETYIETKLEEKNQFATGTIDFIDEQLASVGDSLNKAERELQYIQIQTGSMDITLTAANASQQLAQIETEESALRLKESYLSNLSNELSKDDFSALINPISVGINDPVLADLVNQLKNLNLEKVRKSIGTTGRQNIELQMLNKQISSLRESLRENVRNLISTTNLTMNGLRSRKAKAQQIVRRLPGEERSIQKAKRAFSFSEELYNYLQQRKAEAGISQAANTADSKILDEARLVPGGPVSPNVPFVIAGCLILALALPTLIVFLKDSLNNKITERSQVEKGLDTSIAGSIIHFPDAKDRPIDISLNDPEVAALAESFRYLKVNLQFLAPDKNSKAVALTSTVPKEGKTFCAINLAKILAMTGKKTVLIDADIRKPQVSKRFGISRKMGLSTFLTHQAEVADIIKKTHVPNLSVVTSGQIPPNPGELLEHFRFQELITELKKTFDYVIIDTPPVGLVADFLTISKAADVSFYVVRQNYSKLDFIPDINEITEKQDIKNLYVILNDVKYSAGRYNKYGYRYAYGYDPGRKSRVHTDKDNGSNGIAEKSKLKDLLKKKL